MQTDSLLLASDAVFHLKNYRLHRIIINGNVSKGGQEYVEIDEGAYLGGYDNYFGVKGIDIHNIGSVVMRKHSFFSELILLTSLLAIVTALNWR